MKNTLCILKVMPNNLKNYFSVDCDIVSNGDIGLCHCNSCSKDEGDCDSHDECQDGNVCGANNCPASLGFDFEVDCCTIGLVSPNYPNTYPSNTYKTWLITAPVGFNVNLRFLSFDVR